VTATSDPVALAGRLASAFGAAVPMAPLLHPSIRFMALGRALGGRDAVEAELGAPVYGRLAWQAPVAVGENVRVVGIPAPGSRDRALVLTLGFEDGLIALVQRQSGPAPALPATPLVLPPSLKAAIDKALVERHPILVAYTTPQGQPVLSFRGSVQAFSDDQLALWVRNSEGGFIRSIARNPRVSLMYRNEDAKATYQFQGRARVSSSEADRRRVFDAAPEAERHHDFAQLGVAVLIDLDLVEGYAGLGPAGPIDAVRMQRQA
jgi:hypothetical protein